MNTEKQENISLVRYFQIIEQRSHYHFHEYKMSMGFYDKKKTVVQLLLLS